MNPQQTRCKELLESKLERKLGAEEIYFRQESQLAILTSAETYQDAAIKLKVKRIHCAHESFISFSRYINSNETLEHYEIWKKGASEWYFILDKAGEIDKFITAYGPYYQIEGAKLLRDKVQLIRKKARKGSLYTLLGIGSMVASVPFNFNLIGDILFGAGVLSITFNMKGAEDYIRYALSLKPKGKKNI